MRRTPALFALASGVAVLAASCRHDSPDTTPPASTATAATVRVRPEPLGHPAEGPAWMAHVCAVDLDRDGLVDLVACEARQNQVRWIRQVSRGVFTEQVLATDLRAPVHAEAADVDGDGDLDLLVASMGYVFPNNDRIGTVFVLENDGRQGFLPRAVLEHTERVTDVRAGDFNGDGRLDLAVAQFGYDQGCVSWLEQTAPWTFRRHVLLELSGAINVVVADFNRDGRPDLAALFSQQWEEIHLFENTGDGFRRRRLWGSTNEDFGSSGLTAADLNGDGRVDLVFTNGDGFGPAAVPGPRPWHGVQWLENTGDAGFRFERLGTLPGAYSPVAVDFDGDGRMDIVVSAAFADRGTGTRHAASLVWYRQDRSGGFSSQVLGQNPRDQITVTAADLDGTGQPVLVSGGFSLGQTAEGVGRLTRWRRERP